MTHIISVPTCSRVWCTKDQTQLRSSFASTQNMASTFQKSFTEITAACHCGQLTVSVEVPTASLPLGLNFCACDTCRHNSGHLAITSVGLPSDKRNFQVTGKAERYATSEGPDGLIRCFCGVCGASVYGMCIFGVLRSAVLAGQ